MVEKKKSASSYRPLLALILVAFLGASALRYSTGYSWMHFFMGLLFLQFSLLKLFDIEGFADGFEMYDLIAMKNRQYALAYPVIELALGLAYLSFFIPPLTYLLTIFFMAIGAIGVLFALRKGLDLRCSCMGTALNVPLSTVTLTEDLGMGVMALWMLIT